MYLLITDTNYSDSEQSMQKNEKIWDHITKGQHKLEEFMNKTSNEANGRFVKKAFFVFILCQNICNELHSFCAARSTNRSFWAYY